MNGERHQDTESVGPMSIGEMTRCIRQHDRDLYRGNGLPGVTTRLSNLEAHKDRVEDDLYDPEAGIVPKLSRFFAVVDEREKQSSSKMARSVYLVALIALGTPIAWDAVKHALGWVK